MAIKMINHEWCACANDYKKEFVIDTDADAASLPECCTGSAALAVETGSAYMVNASGVWQKVGAT